MNQIKTNNVIIEKNSKGKPHHYTGGVSFQLRMIRIEGYCFNEEGE